MFVFVCVALLLYFDKSIACVPCWVSTFTPNHGTLRTLMVYSNKSVRLLLLLLP